MWREEGLGFWLEQQAQHRHDRRVRLGERLGSWIKLPGFLPAAVDLSHNIDVEVKPLAQAFLEIPDVVEGLGFIDQSRRERIVDNATAGTEPETARQEPTSNKLPEARGVDLPNEVDAAVRNRALIPAPPVRWASLWRGGRDCRLRSANLFENLPAAKSLTAWFLPAKVAIQIGTPKISRIPHVRRSMDLNELGVHQRENLVHEAEALKGIPHGDGELLAVFLSVPVEVVSQVRFVDEQKQLLYTLMPTLGLTRTRVHDMLAVRNRGTGETHVVPHRTRYRMAFLP